MKTTARRQVLTGKYATRINNWRDLGYSWEWIARELYWVSKKDLDVTAKSLRLWFRDQA